MAQVDYKQKYVELRAKFLESTNMAYRAGYEAATKDAQIQQLTQQVADGQAREQAAAAQAGMMGQDPNAPQEDPNAMPVDGQEGADQNLMNNSPNPNQMPYGDDNQNNPAFQDQQGGGELDSAINELSGMVSKGQKPSLIDLRKSLDKVMAIRQKHIAISELKKSNSLVSETVEKVNDILDKWESEKDSESFEKMVKKKGIKI